MKVEANALPDNGISVVFKARDSKPASGVIKTEPNSSVAVKTAANAFDFDDFAAVGRRGKFDVFHRENPPCFSLVGCGIIQYVKIEYMKSHEGYCE